LHTINKNIISNEKVRAPPSEEAKLLKQQRELTAREKAMQFAANIPKPKVTVVPPPQDQVGGQNGAGGKGGVRQRSAPELGSSAHLRGSSNQSGASVVTSKLDQLEMKHDNARAEIEQMRKEFGL
jgi:hypothetical protein